MLRLAACLLGDALGFLPGGFLLTALDFGEPGFLLGLPLTLHLNLEASGLLFHLIEDFLERRDDFPPEVVSFLPSRSSRCADFLVDGLSDGLGFLFELESERDGLLERIVVRDGFGGDFAVGDEGLGFRLDPGFISLQIDLRHGVGRCFHEVVGGLRALLGRSLRLWRRRGRRSRLRGWRRCGLGFRLWRGGWRALRVHI